MGTQWQAQWQGSPWAQAPRQLCWERGLDDLRASSGFPLGPGWVCWSWGRGSRQPTAPPKQAELRPLPTRLPTIPQTSPSLCLPGAAPAATLWNRGLEAASAPPHCPGSPLPPRPGCSRALWACGGQETRRVPGAALWARPQLIINQAELLTFIPQRRPVGRSRWEPVPWAGPEGRAGRAQRLRQGPQAPWGESGWLHRGGVWVMTAMDPLSPHPWPGS